MSVWHTAPERECFADCWPCAWAMPPGHYSKKVRPVMPSLMSDSLRRVSAASGRSHGLISSKRDASAFAAALYLRFGWVQKQEGPTAGIREPLSTTSGRSPLRWMQARA